VAASTVPQLPCLCANLRRASRALTQLYEDALRPLGLRATQFTLLQALSIAGEVTQAVLGHILAIDSTTLTRALDIMERRGWIAKHRGVDRREWLIRLSRRGEAKLQRALPHWRSVQQRLQTQLGNEVWETLFTVSNNLTNTVISQGDKSS
jgi:DNA-binding MarR family transcriptional regulator